MATNVLLFDKDFCQSVEQRINMGPINLTDLLPLFKQGITHSTTLVNLQKLYSCLSPKCNFTYTEDLRVTEISIKSFEYQEDLIGEILVVDAIQSLFKSKSLTKDNHTIYDFTRVVRFRKGGRCYQFVRHRVSILESYICKILPHPKVDPLLISVLLNNVDLTKEHLNDIRSNKIRVYGECFQISPECCQVIKEEIIKRIMLSGEIFVRDISYHLLSNDML